MIDEQTRRAQYAARRKYVLRLKIGIAAGLILVIALALFLRSRTYRGLVIDPSGYVSVRYQGYDGEGSVALEIDKTGLSEAVKRAYSDYERAIIPFNKDHDEDDFLAFAAGLSGSFDRDEHLANGDTVRIRLKYDRDLADGLSLSLKYDELPVEIKELAPATEITKDDLFAALSISVNGISPVTQVTIRNISDDPFLGSVRFRVKPERDFYKMGESLLIEADYDKEKAISLHYAVDEDASTLEYTVPGDVRYVEKAEDIDDETLKQAVALAQGCFTDANEWGLRIFTEAHLPYSWEGTGDYTFEWSDPRLLSAYVEKKKSENRDDENRPFNYLQLAFEVHIEQADGVGCDAEAVVCFDSMTVDSEGRVDLNPASMQLFTASYIDRNIKNTIRGWFGDYYTLDKIDI